MNLRGLRQPADVLPALAFPRKATRPRYLREVCDIRQCPRLRTTQGRESTKFTWALHNKVYTRSRVFGVSCGNSLRDDL